VRERCVIFTIVNNLIFIEFYSKQNFPPGKWMSEPDLCSWEHKLPCLAIRDMAMGIWKGFVAVDVKHPYYGKSVEDLLKAPEGLDIFSSVYGGVSGAGRLPNKYKEFAKNFWWIGVETSHGGDLMPLLKLDDSNPDMAKMISNQTYKDFRFIRKETNKLANLISKIK
jgi:hypothetical protein